MRSLIINTKDALTTWGVRMYDGFLDSLNTAAPLKEYVTNSNRLKDGVQYCNTVPKLDERDVTLTFTLTGKNHNDFLAKKTAFLEELYKSNVEIEVPDDSDAVYFLKYVKCTVYGQNISRTFAKIGVNFKEPNPARRTRDANL